jgi:CDP-diacylglycerol---glycerol-3-phosphate 3-phosphatidyltransferase
MLFIVNGISFLRAPLAFLFLYDDVFIRLLAVIGAMVTDGLDGYLARKCKVKSKFGAIIDPAMDKFFVFFAATVFLVSDKMLWWQMFLLLFRDFCLFGLGIYLWRKKLVHSLEIRSVKSSKLTTFVQFIVLMALCLNFIVPGYFYFVFVLLGLLALIESHSHFVGVEE